MSILNLDELLQELDPAAPCGPNLEYDPVFLELEQAIVGKPEVQYGTTVTPAVPPEWKTVKKLSLGLLARSRDLRVAVPLVRSLIGLHGMAGMADGLGLIARLMAERWDFVYPQLDPDDDLDPMLRINSLAMLTDPTTMIKEMKEATMVVLPGLGPLNLRDLEIISGELQIPEKQERKTLPSIDASMADLGSEPLANAFEAMKNAHESSVQIESILTRQVGASRTLNLSILIKGLKRGRDFLGERHAKRAGVAADAAAGDGTEGAANADGEAAAGVGASVAAARGNGPVAISGEISSREDVLRMIDKICVYYQKFEPSSPVPILLLRAKGLVPKSFLEILEDLAPDGLKQIAVVSGPQAKPE